MLHPNLLILSSPSLSVNYHFSIFELFPYDLHIHATRFREYPLSLFIFVIIIRGYYMAPWRYEISLRVISLSLRSRLWSSENHWDCRSRKQKRKDKPINLNAMLTIRSSKQVKLCHVSSWIARQNNCPEVKVCPRIRISTKQVSFWVKKLSFKSYNLGKPAIQPRYHLRERSNIWYNTMGKIVIECN